MSKYLKYIISKMGNIISRNRYISYKVTEAHFMATMAIWEEAEVQYIGIFIKNDTDDVINVKISQIHILQNGQYYFSQ